MRIQADFKMGFYKTHLREVYRILTCLTYCYSLKAGMPSNDVYQYIEDEEFDIVDEAYDLSFTNTQNILDPFAGEGEFLGRIRQAGSRHCKSIAIEIDKNRYDAIEADIKHYGAYEEKISRVPEKSISTLLFNPHYGNHASGERNVRHYLRDIVESNILCTSAIVVCVIPKKDLLENLDIIRQDFEIQHFWKAHQEEYDKWGQYVVFLKKRGKIKLDPFNFPSFKEKTIKQIEEEPEFILKRIYGTHAPDYAALLHLAKKKEEAKSNISENTKIWDWVKDDTAKLSKDKIVCPLAPTSGQVANLLVSGYLNGVVEGENTHIVSSGTEMVSRQTKELVEKGEKVTEIRYARPYIRVGYVKDGKFRVKNIISEN